MTWDWISDPDDVQIGDDLRLAEAIAERDRACEELAERLEERDRLRDELSWTLEERDRLRRNATDLRRALTAHHELQNLSDAVLADYNRSDRPGVWGCPVCQKARGE